MAKKWTLIDCIIVVVVAVVAVVGYKMLGGKGISGEKKTIEAEILISNSDKSIAEAIAIGENVTLSLTEKDSGTVKDVKSEVAEIMTYDSENGEYQLEKVDDKVDIYATVEVEVEESDYAFTVGSTNFRVGTLLPFRGKGYATQGYVININEGE